MQNIDVFNFASLEILHQCIDSFPIYLEVDSGKIALAVSNYFEDPKNYDDSLEQFTNVDEICMYTIFWLKDEGFIRVKNENIDEPYTVVISQKGLNAINRVPSSINDKKSFKEVFKNGLSSVPLNVASGLMIEFFK